ncbi:DUF302 domain-containing protein [Caldichromatium japonicum]|uniref:DUF302 domain-containing protein n=1 Tax=Caldichromatium japonicum TaxID=2699430 RepID=A0A6G7VCP9_9GAMM|nr:DUF302 domain-containing protein [Caldichromatium japonicum]QIK37744.1 DUF302 domain-containing protein [Caldichromatium japonicum]
MHKRPWFVLLAALPLCLALRLEPATGTGIDETVVKIPLAEGVSMDDAVESMLLRANALNFKLVARQPLSKELEAMGIASKRIEIFQFCDARIAAQMLAENLAFAAYLPCRITLIEDQQGQAWLITLDLDKVIQMTDLPPALKESAVKVRETIQAIMAAGASGEL